jgi:hypothetical protein
VASTGFGRHRASHGRFWLDSARLATYVICGEEELFGFDSAYEGGFARGIASRFRDAEEAGAIVGPGELEVVLYALDAESLILAVRERELPHHLNTPMRQLATYSFDATDVVSYGDDSFEECCNGIAAILERANELLPSLAALREAELRAVRS